MMTTSVYIAIGCELILKCDYVRILWDQMNFMDKMPWTMADLKSVVLMGDVQDDQRMDEKKLETKWFGDSGEIF